MLKTYSVYLLNQIFESNLTYAIKKDTTPTHIIVFCVYIFLFYW